MTHKIKVNNVEIELTAEMIKEIKALPDEPEFEYPLFMKSKNNGQIVKFTSLYEGVVVWRGDFVGCDAVGYVSNLWTAHTDTTTWEPVPYDKDRCLWHGQPVEVWDAVATHERHRRFYDAINKSVFTFKGKTNSPYVWDNIEAIPPEEYKPWMYEAYKTLEL